ncbi:hypothetical protein K2173_024969 [Erythroxylum novogranatense]|uniref:Uncharacterized protein n=1 Tax=Erythroxylum novogranatense TaxID=1862640 RepID=A0AAV8UCZ8_9ROSI|nr:hypothetical protein K2173_024969 [Erythroxylum novogranatense]
MKLVWSPDTASNAYIDTVTTLRQCGISRQSGVAEFLSSMAAGWNSKLIVESWSGGSSIAASVGLAVAARHSRGRHVCIVPDEESRSEYVKSMQVAGMEAEMVVGEAEEVMTGLAGIDFLVVDSRRRDSVRVLRYAKLGHKGAVLACKNACAKCLFPWAHWLGRGKRVVRSVFLPVGQGLNMAHISSSSVSASLKRGPSRWIKHVDRNSGEEHVFRR